MPFYNDRGAVHPIGGEMDHPLRLMTWNVRSLRDDRSALVDVVRTVAPDVLFVQEAPRFLRARSKLAALAREGDLVVVCGGKPAAGVAILSSLRVSVERTEERLLTKTADLHQRGLAVADLALVDRMFRAACVHLGLNSDERRRHVAEIEGVLGGGDAVLAGDLNETSRGSAWREMVHGRVDVGQTADAATFPASMPTKRIDTIFVPASWATEYISPTEITDDATLIRASDHRPVIVDVMG